MGSDILFCAFTFLVYLFDEFAVVCPCLEEQSPRSAILVIVSTYLRKLKPPSGKEHIRLLSNLSLRISENLGSNEWFFSKGILTFYTSSSSVRRQSEPLPPSSPSPPAPIKFESLKFVGSVEPPEVCGTELNGGAF